MSERRAILIRGAGFQNKGAEALACTAVDELAKRMDGFRFYVEVLSCEAESARKCGLTPRRDASRDGSRKDKLNRLGRVLYRNPSLISAARRFGLKTLLPLDGLPRDISAIVDVSGYAYADVWGSALIGRTCSYIEYCRRNDIKYIFLPQAWGPFTDAEIAAKCRWACRHSVFYARDKASSEHLATLLETSVSDIPRAPDIAFRFKSLENIDGGKLDFNEPIVGIAPNMRMYERFNGRLEENGYVKRLASIGESIVQRGARILLMPHELLIEAGRWDDRILCMLLAYMLRRYGDRVIMPSSEMSSARELKSLLKRCSLVVGSRYHCLVGALSLRVPVVAWGWSHKYQELLSAVGCDGFCVSNGEGDESVLKERVSEAWNNRAAIASSLGQSVPCIEREVEKLFDDVSKDLQKQE